jgi:O-antigen/teichoic acid export membrane protein
VLATGGLLLLTNVDVLLARAYLDPTASGVYAVGSLFAKAAFWGPQFVATLVFPRLAGAAPRSTVLGGGLAVTAALGGLVIVPAAVAAPTLVRIVAGDAYAAAAPALLLFAALGTMLALVQLLVYAGLARGDRRSGVATWVAAGVQAGLVAGPLHSSVSAVATAALLSTALLLATLGAVELRRHRQPSASAGQGGGENWVTSPGARSAAAVNAPGPG